MRYTTSLCDHLDTRNSLRGLEVLEDLQLAPERILEEPVYDEIAGAFSGVYGIEALGSSRHCFPPHVSVSSSKKAIIGKTAATLIG
jgi:hypothetical protein